METPVPILEENGKMTESQLTTAVAFVTELISLGVLDLVPHGVLLMNVCPLFLVAKPGQPDQWICIADMSKGNQHKSCAAYPVHMTCPEDILPQIYPGGFVKLLPLPQPPVRARTDVRTNPSAQRATQLRSVLARVCAVSIQNQITTTVP
jgi:hypothetical protein